MELELGNILFNQNRNQIYACPDYVVALLRDIERSLENVMWNINQKEYSSPFGNTGNSFKCDTFEVEAYNWNDDVEQKYNFKYEDIEISWYKYLGRDTTINGNYPPKKIIDMYNDCISAVYKYEKENSDVWDF